MNEFDLGRIDLNLLVTFEALMDCRSVTVAADRLSLTSSAVSHALGRLRLQLGDPLLVKVGGRMEPSPFALDLIEELRPVLRGLRRMLAPAEPFDPATSNRAFRIMIASFAPLVAAIVSRAQALAPRVALELSNISANVYASVADGLVDLAHVGGDIHLPHGLHSCEMQPFVWYTFAREGHPALANWGPDAWLEWPHLQVKIDTNAISPVDDAESAPASRRIGAKIGEFSSVGAVLVESDLLATLPALLMAEQMERYGLRALRPVVEPAPFRSRLVWSSRLASDPGNLWLRTLVIDIYARMQEEANARVSAGALEVGAGRVRTAAQREQ